MTEAGNSLAASSGPTKRLKKRLKKRPKKSKTKKT